MRDRWRQAAAAWQALLPRTRTEWEAATQEAHLMLTGYNLWLFWWTTSDAAAIHTIERITHRKLIS